MPDSQRAVHPLEFAVVGLLALVGGLLIVPSLLRAEPSPYAAIDAGASSLNAAIERYARDHGRPPDPAAVEFQLTAVTDADGLAPDPLRPGPTYGPYLDRPPVLVIDGSARAGIGSTTGPGTAWIYDDRRGTVAAAAAGIDGAGGLVGRQRRATPAGRVASAP